MKRTPLRRKTPLRAKPKAKPVPTVAPLEPEPARKPLPRVNRKRRRKLFEAQFESPAFVAFVQNCACVVCGGSPCEAAHVTHSRGAGGKACDIAPLCFDCHELQHRIGIKTMELYYEVDLRHEAEAAWAQWCAEQFTTEGT